MMKNRLLVLSLAVTALARASGALVMKQGLADHGTRQSNL
jgi:hypothetical protein